MSSVVLVSLGSIHPTRVAETKRLFLCAEGWYLRVELDYCWLPSERKAVIVWWVIRLLSITGIIACFLRDVLDTHVDVNGTCTCFSSYKKLVQYSSSMIDDGGVSKCLDRFMCFVGVRCVTCEIDESVVGWTK